MVADSAARGQPKLSELTEAGVNRALVVGGGFGGIASAIRLRAKGYEVERWIDVPGSVAALRFLNETVFGSTPDQRSLPRPSCLMSCLSYTVAVAKTTR